MTIALNIPKATTPPVEDLKKYREAVEVLAKAKTSFVFPNTGPDHASIVISTIFKTSENIVRIYANKMDGGISDRGDYLESLENFVRSGKKLKVVVKNKPPESKLYFLLQSLSTEFPDAVKVKKAGTHFLKNVSEVLNDDIVGEKFFVVGDEKSYRAETNNEVHNAFCDFKDEYRAKQLITSFDKDFDFCNNLF